MVRMRRIAPLAALISSLLVFSFAGAASAAGSPKAQFTFSICQTLIDTFDGDGNPIQVAGIEMLYSWSGAYVDNVQGSWTRTDGQPVNFGFVDTDFTAGTSGSVDAGALGIQDDAGLDGVVGVFAVHRHVLATRNIAEPEAGWTSVPACT